MDARPRPQRREREEEREDDEAEPWDPLERPRRTRDAQGKGEAQRREEPALLVGVRCPPGMTTSTTPARTSPGLQAW